MPSLDSVNKAIETRRQLTDMGDKAGFHVTKWVSNFTGCCQMFPKKTELLRLTREEQVACDESAGSFLDCVG